jgi:DNA-binding NarL/FixJ family response regulator
LRRLDDIRELLDETALLVAVEHANGSEHLDSHAFGVRRRLAAAKPETNGSAALTTSRLTVARLVAEGLTN